MADASSSSPRRQRSPTISFLEQVRGIQAGQIRLDHWTQSFTRPKPIALKLLGKIVDIYKSRRLHRTRLVAMSRARATRAVVSPQAF